MTNKEQILKLIEGRIETMTALSIECIDLIYKAGYNEGIEDVLNLKETDEYVAKEIRKLKK